MDTLLLALGRRLTTAEQDGRFVGIAFFAAALALLVLGLVAVARMASGQGELLIGVMLTLGLAMQLVIAGFVVPDVIKRNDA